MRNNSSMERKKMHHNNDYHHHHEWYIDIFHACQRKRGRGYQMAHVLQMCAPTLAQPTPTVPTRARARALPLANTLASNMKCCQHKFIDVIPISYKLIFIRFIDMSSRRRKRYLWCSLACHSLRCVCSARHRRRFI